MEIIGERHYLLQLGIGIERDLVDAFGEDYIRDEFEGAVVEQHLALMEEYRALEEGYQSLADEYQDQQEADDG